MKILKLLTAGIFTLMASTANAASVFEATNMDINIANTSLGGIFAIFDNAGDVATANGGTPTDHLLIAEYDRIDVDAIAPATTQMTNGSDVLAITNSNFVFAATTSDGSSGWIIGEGTELGNPGSNIWEISFPEIRPELKLVVDIAAVPVPAAVWLFGSGLLGLVGIARRRV